MMRHSTLPATGNQECGILQPACNFVDAGQQVANVVDFASDPYGRTFEFLRDAALSISRDIVPELTAVTQPDLSLDWFLQAYALAFAAATFAAVIMLMFQFAGAARGSVEQASGLTSAITNFGLFFGGAVIAPWLGWWVVQLMHALSDVFIAWGVGGSMDTALTGLESMIEEYGPATAPGGLLLGIVFMACICFGLIGVFLMLLVQLVTLYFVGVLLPLALMWLMSPQHRHIAGRFVAIWVGILAAHPLLFFVLGVAYWMMGTIGGTAFGSSGPLEIVAQLAVASIAFLLAAFSPMLLMKVAPLLPGTASMPNVPMPAVPIGAPSMHDAVDRASQPYSRGQSDSSPGESSSSGRPVSFDTPTAAATGGSSSQAPSGIAGAATEGAAATESAPATAGAGASSAAVPAAASAGAAGSAAATTASAAEGAGAVATAGEAAAATGGAATATGVGAAVGVPVAVAGLTAAAAAEAAASAKHALESTADAVASPIDGDDPLFDN